MAQNVFILSAEEYSMVQGMTKRIEQLENENKTLREFNSKKRSQIDKLQSDLDLQSLSVLKLKMEQEKTSSIISNLRKMIAEFEGKTAALESVVRTRESQINEMKRDMKGTEDALKLARIELACWESGGL